MNPILFQINEYCELGLNSDNPKHWEAALQDILRIIRTANPDLIESGTSKEDIFYPPQGSVNLHEDEDAADNELYDPVKDPTVEREEHEVIPF